MRNTFYSIKTEKWSCPLSPKLKINGTIADIGDFVEVSHDCDDACCVNIKVKPINRTTKILSVMNKYDLSPEQMEEIQDKLVYTIGLRNTCGLCM